MLNEEEEILHIALAKFADLVLIAPASAHTIAKLAHGFADCLLSSLCLATNATILLAPAMNKVMWGNQLVQKNLTILRAAGVQIIEPAYGKQACGDVGFGKMAEISQILEHCSTLITTHQRFL